MLNSSAILGLCLFAQVANPAWKAPNNCPPVEALAAARQTHKVVADLPKGQALWVRWWAMARLESSFRVRRYDKTVSQRTDYHGAHYNLLAQQARIQGLINWPKGIPWSVFKKSQEWAGFKDHLKWHPDEGDALAFSAFVDLVDHYGLDVATAGWKVDPEEYRKGQALLASVVPGRAAFTRREHRSLEATWNGGTYLAQVKELEKGLLSCMLKAKVLVLREPRRK